MKTLMLLFIAGLLAITTKAQTILMEENVNQDTLPKTFGPNLKHYLHSYLSYGLVIGQPKDKGMDVKPGNSSELVWGIRYKNRLSNFLAIGAELNYGIQYFALKQDSSKIFPNNILHKKERFSFNNIGLSGYFRVNFDKKRGNVIGKYMDIGGYANWAFLTKHYTKDANADPETAGSKFVEVTNSRLTYAHPFNYGTTVRVGYKSLALYGKYRISNLFDPNHGFPEPPKFMLGIELGTIN